MHHRNLNLFVCLLPCAFVLTVSICCSAAPAQTKLAPAQDYSKQESKKEAGSPYSSSYSSPYINYQQETMSFLMNSVYQKELEMTDEQIKLVKDMNKEMYTGYTKIYNSYPELKDKKLDRKKRSEIFKKVQAEYAVLKKEIEKKLLDQLVPNQKTVLKGLRFNRTLRYYGLSGTLTRSAFAGEFETSDSQKAELEKIKKESEAEIYKLIEAKRADAREKMLKVLNAKQRKKLKELKGDTTEPSKIRL